MIFSNVFYCVLLFYDLMTSWNRNNDKFWSKICNILSSTLYSILDERMIAVTFVFTKSEDGWKWAPPGTHKTLQRDFWWDWLAYSSQIIHLWTHFPMWLLFYIKFPFQRYTIWPYFEKLIFYSLWALLKIGCG